MNKFKRRMAIIAMTAALAVSSASTAFAAASPTKGTYSSASGKTTVKVHTRVDKTATIIKIKSKSSKKAIVNAKIKVNGVNYRVTKIYTDSLTSKIGKVTFKVYGSTRFSSHIVRGKAKKNVKKIVIKAAGKKKFKASNFSRYAFTGYKGTIKISKGSMTKREYKKLVKKLRKGGFKGKITLS